MSLLVAGSVLRENVSQLCFPVVLEEEVGVTSYFCYEVLEERKSL